MSTFQAIVFAIIRGFTEFLPVSAGAHTILVPYLLNWQEPSGAFQGALSLGALLALLVYFRHDWASQIAGFLSMIFQWKRPRILDEWMSIFLALSTIPVAIGWVYLHTYLEEVTWAPWIIALILAASSLLLVFGENMSRGNKGMFDWNWLDASVVGIFQLGHLVPGFGRITGAMSAGLFRNYTREAIVKYTLFASAPILAASCWLHLHEVSIHSHQPMEGVSWLSFSVAVLVTFLTGLLAIGGLLKQIERKGFSAYAVYRVLFAAGVGAVYWMRNR